LNSLLDRGAFVLSIDTELGRGSEQIRLCQEVVNPLLELMERFDIRATWALLGYMFKAKCYSVSSANCLGLSPGHRMRALGEPFTEGPCTQQLSSAPSWSGENAVQQILNCAVPQEIGCHTFSHMKVGDPSCSRECFESDLIACQSEAKKLGVNLRSFIFPWNSVGHLDSLHRCGFIAYRGPSHSWFTNLPVSMRRLAHLLDHVLLIPPPVVTASYEKGVWNLPASYFYACGAGWGKMIPISLRLNKVKKGLRQAVKKRRIFHLWFHPFNLVHNPQVWLKGLENIFTEVNRYRKMGLLENPSMVELACELQRSAEVTNTDSHSSSLTCRGGL
jgi:hypothetical protein